MTVRSEDRFRNAYFPIEVTFAGIKTDVIGPAALNAESPMLVSWLFDANDTELRPAPVKALSPIVTTPAGITTEESALACAKALDAIRMTLVGTSYEPALVTG